MVSGRQPGTSTTTAPSAQSWDLTYPAHAKRGAFSSFESAARRPTVSAESRLLRVPAFCSLCGASADHRGSQLLRFADGPLFVRRNRGHQRVFDWQAVRSRSRYDTPVFNGFSASVSYGQEVPGARAMNKTIYDVAPRCTFKDTATIFGRPQRLG